MPLRRRPVLVPWLSFAWLLLASCAGLGSVRLRAWPGLPVEADAVAVLPVTHRFTAHAHEAFTRALPLCDAVLADSGLLVLGPDEVPLERRLLAQGEPALLDTLGSAALRAGLSPGRLLLFRAFVEEQVSRSSQALFDGQGRVRGAAREVRSSLRVRVTLHGPGGLEPLAEGVASAREDPFAELPDHDRRPLVRALIAQLAPEVLRAGLRRVAGGGGGPRLGARAYPSPGVLEAFRLGTEPSLADQAARDPLLGAGIRDVRRRALGASVGERELAVWAGAPGGTLLRDGLGEARRGDVVLEVGGEAVRTPWALHRALRRAPPGRPAVGRVWRGGEGLGVALARP